MMNWMKQKLRKFKCDRKMQAYLKSYDICQPVKMSFDIPSAFRYAEKMHKSVSELTEEDIKILSAKSC